jgi:hypothetical protein
MALATEGKKVCLEAWGAAAVKCDLHDDTDTILEGSGYAQQDVTWTYDGVGVILNADDTLDIVAEFDVPAVTVKYVVFKKGTGEVMAKHDLDTDAETFTNPGVYQLTAASLELDPTP